ncbi:MAG: cytochrome c1 [Alphaproteobacteria bacterium]|nr:cytochrome c1 [Alphaproteobacteria bacterium]
MLRRLILAAAAVLAFAAAPAFAETEAEHPENYPFSFEGVFGTYDRASVQRGFAVYSQVCAACHALEHMSYRNLGELPDGPFLAYRVTNEETGAQEITLTPHGHHGKPVDPNDNPYVRSIAEAATISAIDRETGQPTDRPGRPSDRFRSPFPNESAARLANGGALPPDLSVIVNARHGGADYIRSLLLGYGEPPAGVEVVEGKYYNRYFPGGWIAMAPPLVVEGQASYSDETVATIDQMATDVAHFLEWAADPKMAHRKSMGFSVMIFLLLLAGLTYTSYRLVWRNEKH